MIVAVGVDSIEIERIETLWQNSGERFLQRVFTVDEADYCRSRHKPAESLAARFAVKEAVMKCLGTGWGEGLGFRDIEVRRLASGAVRIQLAGPAANRALQLGIRHFHASLTHTKTTATAFVIAEA